MPEKVILDDGTEREVPTEEEWKGLQTASEKNKTRKQELADLSKSFELEEGQTMEEKIAEMKESSNPNWAKARKEIKALKQIAKDKGVEIDDKGDIVPEKVGLTAEEIDEKIDKRTSEKAQDQLIDKALSGYAEADAKSIKETFKKLNSLGGDVEENLDLAISKVLPGQTIDRVGGAFNSMGGGAPRKVSGDKVVGADVKQLGLDKFGLYEEDFKN